VIEVAALGFLVVASLVTLLVLLPGQLRPRRSRATAPAADPADPAEPAGPGAAELIVLPGLDGAAGEALLVSRLLSGEVSPAEYQRGMAVLAAQDAELHPLVVPPDRGY
jgi:hypothetical protein